ncbi:hypothetical protein AHF37_04958 [Paragonimus kellicotti]|nr:hypothetical protein AHF37_04958 [Paragonimus kellicotti]
MKGIHWLLLTLLILMTTSLTNTDSWEIGKKRTQNFEMKNVQGHDYRESTTEAPEPTETQLTEEWSTTGHDYRESTTEAPEPTETQLTEEWSTTGHDYRESRIQPRPTLTP